MIKSFPKSATGDHELVAVLNRIYDLLRERSLLPGPGYEVDYLAQGQRIRLNSKPSGSGGGGEIFAGALNMVYRGEWSPYVAYNAQDVVILSNGDQSGTYVAPFLLSAGGATPGAANSDWVLIGTGGAGNIWL